MASNDNFNPKEKITEFSHLLESENFANLFCHVASTNKNIDKILKEIIKGLINSDKETQDGLKLIIRTLQKDEWILFGRKIGTVVGSVFLLVIGAVLHAFAASWFKIP